MSSHGPDPSEILDRLLRWAESYPAVRAILLTSSRALPDAPTDRLSDYDPILVVSDLAPFSEDGWLHAYGQPMVRLPLGINEDTESELIRLVIYEDGTKIDYTVWTVARFQEMCEGPRLPAELDAGYLILLDKDGLTTGLGAPSYTAYIPPRPTEAEFLAVVEEFWWESTYVAKNLWRGELLPARYSFESVMTFDLLRRMLEWSVEIEHGWSHKPGVLGRGLKRLLPPEIWTRVEATFAGADIEENWEALFAAGGLFHDVCVHVANHLGFTYPHDLDRHVTDYLKAIRSLER